MCRNGKVFVAIIIMYLREEKKKVTNDSSESQCICNMYCKLDSDS